MVKRKLGSDFFISVDKDLTKDQTEKKIESPLLYFTDNNPEVYFLMAEIPSDHFMRVFRSWIANTYDHLSYAIVYCFKYKILRKELNKNLFRFFIKNTRDDLSVVIPQHSKVIPIGRAIYATTFNTDISVQRFYDSVWNKTHFYSPFLNSEIFPVDESTMWLGKAKEGEKYDRMLDNFYQYFLRNQIRRALNFNDFKRIPTPNKIYLDDPNEFMRNNMENKSMAVDIETSSLNVQIAQLGCVTVSFDGQTGYYIDLLNKSVDLELLAQFINSKYIIGANFSYDVKVFRNNGVNVRGVDYDTLQAGHTLNEMGSNSLKTHAFVYSPYGGYDLPLELYKLENPRVTNYLLFPEEMKREYAIMDAIVTFRTYEGQLAQFEKDPDVKEYFFKWRMPVINEFIDIEYGGVYVNWNNAEKASIALKNKIQAIREKIYKKLGARINIDSGKILGEYLEHTLELPEIERSKVGYYLTNKDCLETWSDAGFEIADLFLEYSKYQSIMETFIGERYLKSGIWQYKDITGTKVYPSIATWLARSHRNRYSNPNLQNQPHHDEELGPLVRSIFDVPSDDFVIGSLDYAGLQLRIGAILSNDENMRKAFVEMGGDLHSLTNQIVFYPQLTLEEVLARKEEHEVHENRHISKTINFKFLFGGKAYSFSKQTIEKTWSKKQCMDYIIKNNLMVKSIGDVPDPFYTVAEHIRSAFFTRYSGLAKWLEDYQEFASKHGYIRSPFGARRLLPQLLYEGKDPSMKLIANLKNIALNSPVQNFETVIVNSRIAKLQKYFKENGYKSRVFVTVHDEIGFYFHKEELKKGLINKVIIPIMIEQLPEYNGIPVEVDGTIADPRDLNDPTYWGYGSEKIVS